MLWKLFTHFHLSVNIASVMHSYLSITSVFHSGTHICRQSRMHYCFPPCCEPGLSNEWKPFSPIPPTASDSHFSAICCSTPRSYPRCCVSPLLCPLFPQLFLLLSSSFFQSCYVSFSMKARHGLTHSANKGVCRRSFIPTKSHWSLSSFTCDDKVPFAADAQKGQGCRCIFAWGIEWQRCNLTGISRGIPHKLIISDISGTVRLCEMLYVVFPGMHHSVWSPLSAGCLARLHHKYKVSAWIPKTSSVSDESVLVRDGIRLSSICLKFKSDSKCVILVLTLWGWEDTT